MSQRTLYASAARTATPTAVTVNTARLRALRLVIDITAVTSTPAVTITVDAIDAVSGKFVNLITSAALAAVATTTLIIGPGVTVGANTAVSNFLGDSVRVTATHGNSNSATYTISAHLIP